MRTVVLLRKWAKREPLCYPARAIPLVPFPPLVLSQFDRAIPAVNQFVALCVLGLLDFCLFLGAQLIINALRFSLNFLLVFFSDFLLLLLINNILNSRLWTSKNVYKTTDGSTVLTTSGTIITIITTGRMTNITGGISIDGLLSTKSIFAVSYCLTNNNLL